MKKPLYDVDNFLTLNKNIRDNYVLFLRNFKILLELYEK